MRTPQAAQKLTRWANMWATTSIPLPARIPWLQMMGIGGDKGNGKARPIVFQEVLLKLAAGCISQVENRSIAKQVGDAQYAAGTHPGTTQLIWEIEAEMATFPDDLFFSLDIENAFGTTRRPDAHKEALSCSTPTAQLQWNSWYGGAEQHVWLQIGNDWHQTTMPTGVCQGGCSAIQDFMLAFARAQRTVSEHTRTAAGATARHLAHPMRLYVDDQCLRVPRHAWRCTLQAIQRGLAAHGYRLRLDKTKAHCPAAQTRADLAAELTDELAGSAEFSCDGLPLLGKLADGEHYTILTASGPLSGPTATRMATARILSRSLHSLLDTNLPTKALGPTWKLTSLVLNKALSYDICVSTPDRLRPHTDELDDLVAALARRLTDPGLADAPSVWNSCLAQLREPRQHGGLNLASATTLAPYAFLSAALATLPAATTNLTHLRTRQHDLQPDQPTTQEALDYAIGSLEGAGLFAAATAAQMAIATQGVLIDVWGMPRTTIEAPMCIREVAKAGIDLRHRRRAWLRLRADRQLAMLPPELRAHRWTHGGEEGGLGFAANASSDIATWDDMEFTINLSCRLRLRLAEPG